MQVISSTVSPYIAYRQWTRCGHLLASAEAISGSDGTISRKSKARSKASLVIFEA